MVWDDFSQPGLISASSVRVNMNIKVYLYIMEDILILRAASKRRIGGLCSKIM